MSPGGEARVQPRLPRALRNVTVAGKRISAADTEFLRANGFADGVRIE